MEVTTHDGITIKGTQNTTNVNQARISRHLKYVPKYLVIVHIRKFALLYKVKGSTTQSLWKDDSLINRVGYDCILKRSKTFVSQSDEVI